MDVDCIPGTSGTAMATSNLSPTMPQIDEDSAVHQKSAKQKITEILDILECRVEKLRKEAAKIEEDKDNILASLDSVRHAEWISELDNFEQDETQRYIDRIIDRCLTVDIKIHTQRDQPQEEALHQVNHLIDSLVITLKTDAEQARERCISYMNACASHNVYGITDKKFENALLGCTLDDQKRVKKRLHGLLSYLEKLDVTCEENWLNVEEDKEVDGFVLMDLMVEEIKI
ncbi:BAG family molecular chaperone regulator 2 isoform X1 [Onthophagus taurus]|uniref:BAG family molecular chaperone regulator 2 isoform X1 n=2 Tax=Onthophagus taurus TaxID=166361 RepID=UPI0039BEB4F8